MRCRQARKLFGAYWDDESTQAEREWLEAHFVSCQACRGEYEAFARSLEMMATLPRVEAAPDLAERALARARRASTVPDRIPRPDRQWVPVAAAAALLLVVASLMTPWIAPGGRLLDTGRSARMEARGGSESAELTSPVAVAVPEHAAAASKPTVGLSDSLFDHTEDVEFILDPVTVRRGQPSMSRTQPQVQGEQAVISF